MAGESQSTYGRVQALERGLAAAVERIERLERETLPRTVPGWPVDADEQEDAHYILNTRTGERYPVETVPGRCWTAP